MSKAVKVTSGVAQIPEAEPASSATVPLGVAGTMIRKLQDRVRFLEVALKADNALHREGRHYEKQDLPEAVQYLVEIRHAVDAIEDMLKYVKKMKAAWEEKVIPTKFDISKTSTITVNGFRITTAEKAVCSIVADAKDEAYAWLRKNDDFGDELKTLLIETVSASTLSASMKEAMKDKGIEFPEELFNFTVLPSVSVTQVKPKAK